MSHDHHHHDPAPGLGPLLAVLRSGAAGRAVGIALAALVVGVVAGLVVLWPAGDNDPERAAWAAGGTSYAATVERVVLERCQLSRAVPCQVVEATLDEGPDSGDRTALTLSGTDVGPEVRPGDTIRLTPNTAPEGSGVDAYSFADFERRRPLLLLAVLFVVLVVALGRWKGVRSLVGLVLSLLVVTQFIAPAMLEGTAPLAVAMVGALAVMLLTIGLAHGVGVTSVAAVLGSAAALLATALLAVLFAGLAHITGTASEEATLLGAAGGTTLSLSGIVLAGIVVGALGVLDDVTVSQASTVLALRRANPALRGAQLFREGLSVGRDHLSATVNTLVLAYVGAALPVLLIFTSGGVGFGDAANRESVASEIVAMLVGSIGLILAVPLTTALAAWLARALPARSAGT